MDWKIRYANGVVISSDELEFEDAPQMGVLCINVLDNNYGAMLLNGKEFYFKAVDGAPNDLYGTNDLRPQFRLRSLPLDTDWLTLPWVKVGVGVSSARFRQIIAEAAKDPDFPRSQHPMRRSTDREG